MTLVKSVKGRLPMNSGDYDSSKVYGKKYRCNLYGCEWESLIEGNNSAPATLVDGVVTPNTAKWRLVSGVPGNYGLDQVVAELDAAKANKANTLDGYGINNAYTKEEVNNLITTPNQQYVSVTATDQTADVTDILPATGAADTTYRVGNWDGTQYNDSVFSEYAWNGSAYIKLSTKSQIGEVYDISANHADTKYADLAAALGTNGANIPQSLRKGGMSVKFVQTSDNKYVQYRLMSDSFNTTVANWQETDYMHSITKTLYGYDESFQNKKIDNDGNVVNNVGTYITDYIPVSLNTGDTVLWKYGLLSDDCKLAVYNSSKVKLNDYSATPDGERTLTMSNNDIAYIRATFDSSYPDALIILNGNNECFNWSKQTANAVRLNKEELSWLKGSFLDSMPVEKSLRDKKLNSDGTLSDAQGSYVTPLIPVNALNGNTIIWKYGALDDSCKLLIYREDGSVLDNYSAINGETSREITLLEGTGYDTYYIRATFQNDFNGYIVDKNTHDIYYTVVKSSEILFDEVFDKVKESNEGQKAIQNSADNVSLIDVANGVKDMIKDFLELQKIFSEQRGYDLFFSWDGVLKYIIPTDTNKWWGQTFSLTPPSGSYIYIKIRYRFTQIQAQPTLLHFAICNYPDPFGDNHYPTIDTISGLDTDIHEKLITIDPAYWQMYQGIGNTFYLWLLLNNDYATGTETIEIYDLQMFYIKQKFEGNIINGSNAKELFESVDNALGEVNITNNGITLVKPDMKKFALQLNNSGEMITVPFIPNKVKWTGNSLAGNIASETGQGWRYYLEQALTAMGATSIGYVTNANIEESTTEAMVDTAVATIVAELSGDEDMVVIQLGDNTSPADRQAVFAYEVVKLLSEIRKKCPAARVFWMGCWYPTNEIMQKIKDGVKKTGAYFCDISAMNNSENDNHIGGIYHSAGPEWSTEPIQQTLDNVSDVDEITHNHLVVTFTLNGIQYVSDEIEVDSWSLSGTTLTYTSVWGIIKSTGVASHPSDLGMKKIANKFLKDAGLFEGDYYEIL